MYNDFDIPSRDRIGKMAQGTNFTKLLVRLIDEIINEPTIIYIYSDGFDNSRLREPLICDLNAKIQDTNTILHTFGTGKTINYYLLCDLNRHSPNCQQIDLQNITVNMEPYLQKTNEERQYINVKIGNRDYNNVEVINDTAVIELRDANTTNEQTNDPEANRLIETYLTQKCLKNVIANEDNYDAIDVTCDDLIVMDFIDSREYNILEDCINGIKINARS
jgi:hypothetical protein